MKFEASLDTLAKILTLGVFVMLAVAGYGILGNFNPGKSNEISTIGQILIVALFFLIPIGTYVFAPRYYKIKNGNLSIVRPIGNVNIPLSSMVRYTVADKGDLGFIVRIFGNGGLFGYYGKYKTNQGLVNMYATQRRNYVIMETESNKKIVLTPDDREGFIAELRVKLNELTPRSIF